MENRKIISAPVVQKFFYKKNGEKTDRKEYYLQLSVQDYFIKFCESEVTADAFRDYVDQIESPLKTVKLEVEFREGEWDRCGAEPAQSRVGAYVVIWRIIPK